MNLRKMDITSGCGEKPHPGEPENNNVGSLPERSEIDERYKWKLDRIFTGWGCWEESFLETESALPTLADLQGTLGKSGDTLLSAIESVHDVQRILEQILVFAGMKSDEDTRNSENTGRKGRASSLAVRFQEATSWFDAELLDIPADRMAELRAEEAGLDLYEHFFADIKRATEHTLSIQQEALLASAGLMARGASQVFNAFDNADLELGEIVDSDGQTVALTKARYSKYLKSGDRRVRHDSYNSFLDGYGSMVNTLAANMDANVKNHVFFAQARKHEGTLDAALFPDAVPPKVFHSLIEAVTSKVDVIQRFTELKKRVLNLDPLHEYDLAVPLFHDGEFSFEYDEACDLLLEAFKPLGPDYVAEVKNGINGGWIDVHENVGKRSGGYSNGVYDTPPFILLNWGHQLGDTFTLAHELGHSMHSLLSVKNQPYVYGDYPIFTAEVASTFNELLLMDHLLKTTENPQKKLFLLDYNLSQINNTVFRQTMFAEFEYRMHVMGEEGHTLTADTLNKLYQELLVKYWGPQVQFDAKRSPITWSRIPHFFYNYYVYQYATAYSGAVALSRKVIAGDKADRESYLDILRSGCSRYPVETVGLGGVDLASPKPMTDVISLFGSLIDQVEELL